MQHLDCCGQIAAMMLGFQGSTPSKVYHCVACSATFTGLASLLVHQATHASTIPKAPAPPQPGLNPPEKPLDSSSEQPKALPPLPESSSPSFYICDCGEEFQDFNLMLEHKRSHVSEHEVTQPPDNNKSISFGKSEVFSTQPGLVPSHPSTSRSPVVELPKLTVDKSDVNLEDDIAMVTSPQGEITPCQDGSEKQFNNMLATQEKMLPPGEDCQDQEQSVLSSENAKNYPRKNSVMKLLASAYMKRFTGSQALNQKHDTVGPKQEVVPADILSGEKTKASPVSDLSIAELRRLLAKPNKKTKAPSISRVLESSRKNVVSLTKTLSPVVVLETRQKLRDPNTNGTYGKYQCGRCRRVFENLDRLTEHHFLHKKERIKCCRRCKQLIIGRMPLPDKHICPQLGRRAIQLSKQFKKKLPCAPKIVPFHTLSNTRKVFFCPVCKHSYARRWNLKNHKCQGPRSAAALHAGPSVQQILLERPISDSNTDTEVRNDTETNKSVAVGTEVTRSIKEELTSSDLEQSAPAELTWAHPAKSFPPFFSKSSMMEHKDASMGDVTVQKVEERDSWNEDDEDSNEGQWTMPLDDEMEVYGAAEKTDNGTEQQKPGSVETAHPCLSYFVSDGVKRYPCNRCQKTYSRPSTLNRHLRLCGFRPHGAVAKSISPSTFGANTIKPMFPCSVCGRSFNRKDNMMTHKKRCQLRHPVNAADTGTAPHSVTGNASDSQAQDDDGSTWGIMSLPSVLPRRVTCECGIGFTSPRLLLEHLQKHAQESYTCPTCGETVNSWADYEVHLQIHMHPHNQLLKTLQPQRSQPLLIRFKQQRPQQQPSPTLTQPAQTPAVTADQLPNPARKQQRIVCIRCSNTFATHCSLRRHIARNRCRGLRATNPPTNPPKTYRCLHCNTIFHNAIGLLFHQRSGACKPAIKPVRCPVCPRWFGTVDGLQKHLLTHKKSESYRCDICQGTYPSLKSLKNHRRRIHRILVGDSLPRQEEELTS